MASRTHVQRVRILYKTILRLHRGLPVEIRPLGDGYVRDEFRRHKKCVESEAIIFLHEWTVSTSKNTPRVSFEGYDRRRWRVHSNETLAIDGTQCVFSLSLSVELCGFSRRAARVERSSHGKSTGQISQGGGRREAAGRASVSVVRIDDHGDGENNGGKHERENIVNARCV